MIVSALACGPTVLLADEPTTTLDATIQVQVLTPLAELKQSCGTSGTRRRHSTRVLRARLSKA